MSFTPSFSLICKKCDQPYVLDSYAIDTHTCQNKHVFFFKCPQCGGFTATAMANIPQHRWHEFVAAEKLDGLISQYNMAMRKSG
jgi:hypothetical protein